MVFFNKEKVLEEIYDDLLDIEEHRKYSDVVSKEEEFAEIIENLNDILEFKFLYYEANNSSFKSIFLPVYIDFPSCMKYKNNFFSLNLLSS